MVSFRDEIKEAMLPLNRKDMQAIRNLRTIPFAYAMRGILSRLGFIYDEETGYHRRLGISIKYDKLKKDYEVMRNGSSCHIYIDAMISIADEKLKEGFTNNSKAETNYISSITEEAEVFS